MARLWIALLAATAGVPNAVVTVYRVGDHGAYASTTTTAAAAGYTGSAAYDPTVLDPPAPPEQLNREFVVLLPQAEPNGTSGPIPGSYLGFSIELSVANRVIGKNSSVLAVPFLNHMANVANRVGAVRVRVGGNKSNTTTWTLHVEFAPDLVKMLANYASLVKTEILLGLNFMDLENTSNQEAFAGLAEETLGSNLHGIALGNEPDLYDRPNHMKRPDPYTFEQYMAEWAQVSSRLATNPASNPKWSTLALANEGCPQRFTNELKIVTVQRYPDNNCDRNENPSRSLPTTSPTTKSPNTPQNISNSPAWSKRQENRCTCSKPTQPHAAASPASPTRSGRTMGDPTGHSSSPAQGSARRCCTLGARGDYYNPFTPPAHEPVDVSAVDDRVGVLQRVDRCPGVWQEWKESDYGFGRECGENLTLGYVVYEDGVPSRVLLINYVDDPSGAHDITANIQIEGGAQLSQVRVRYFEAPSVSFKGNITWAGQTLGNHFESDGRLKGEEVHPLWHSYSSPHRVRKLIPSQGRDSQLRDELPDPGAAYRHGQPGGAFGEQRAGRGKWTSGGEYEFRE
ncbi:Glycoside hydrolase family 79 protein [Rhizoctonia solani]|uniref:Glycoside hydrolase family 79 protein n=1 Tax=Rhizoctonia solani TaxID=456999 RepID=A0A8H7M3A5_9AGAM|nr:Glycoside hydrolase family 79 protein [Rhizoctonia solani]